MLDSKAEKGGRKTKIFTLAANDRWLKRALFAKSRRKNLKK